MNILSEAQKDNRIRQLENASARLARLLAVVVAHADGRVDIPHRHFEELPGNVKLIEHYDGDTDCIVLRTGVVKSEHKEPSEPAPSQLTEPKPGVQIIKPNAEPR